MMPRAAALGAIGVALLLACTRTAEIRDEVEGGSVVIDTVPLPEGGVPEVPDSGLHGPDVVACSERPKSDCAGVNDFSCDYSSWVNQLVRGCQAETDCAAYGWLSLSINHEGCIDALGMTDPEPNFVACLVERVSAKRCRCVNESRNVYLGVAPGDCP